MPAMNLRAKLKKAIGNRALTAVATEAGIGDQQIRNILDGRTEPWNVRVRTAQALVEKFPFHIGITDFYEGRVKVTRK